MRYIVLLGILLTGCQTVRLACDVGQDDLVLCRDAWYSSCGVHLRDCVDDYRYDCLHDVRCIEVTPGYEIEGQFD